MSDEEMLAYTTELVRTARDGGGRGYILEAIAVHARPLVKIGPPDVTVSRLECALEALDIFAGIEKLHGPTEGCA